MKNPSGKLLLLAGILFSASIVPVPAAGQDKLSLKTVVIDPGHGGHDSGCISPDKKTYEKNLTLSISKLFAEKIRSTCPDVRVIMTRDDDRYVTLSGRADIANNAGADLFVSIHINAQQFIAIKVISRHHASPFQYPKQYSSSSSSSLSSTNLNGPSQS